jgi:hypothetical protein
MAKQQGWHSGPNLNGRKTAYNNILRRLSINGRAVQLTGDGYQVALALLLWREQVEERRQRERLELYLPLWKLQALADLPTLQRALEGARHARRVLGPHGLYVLVRPGRGYVMASLEDYIGAFNG